MPFKKGGTWSKKGENNPLWKGEKVTYRYLHQWVERILGKPNYCTICKNTEKKYYDWANISGFYKRELSDWMRLCKSCHSKHDLTPKRLEHLKQMRSKRKNIGAANPKNKLTEDQAIKILNSKEKRKKLAGKYRVAVQTISRIRNRKTWKYLNQL